MDKIRVVNDKKVHMKYVIERVEREKYEEQEEERTEGQKKIEMENVCTAKTTSCQHKYCVNYLPEEI